MTEAARGVQRKNNGRDENERVEKNEERFGEGPKLYFAEKANVCASMVYLN